MKLGDIRLIDHPRGREAMLGWTVSTTEGVGVIRQITLLEDAKKQMSWQIRIEIFSPSEKLGKAFGFAPDEITIVGDPTKG